jgi:DNA-binding NarL/FixJ family response regulator
LGTSRLLVGRRPEITVLYRLVTELANGRGGAVVIDGEPGIGKSRLLDELAYEAVRVGVRCARGQGAEVDFGQPFAPLIGALDLRVRSLDPGAAAIGRRLERRRTGGPFESSDGWRVTNAIVDHLERATELGPVLVALDDLQWADPATLRALRVMARLVPRAPLGVAIAQRPMPRSAQRDVLLGDLATVGAATLRLTRLTDPEMAELVGVIAGAPPGPRLAQLVGRAGGNPLYVVQLVASLRSHGQLDVGAVAEAVSEDVPADLRDVVLRRVDRLSETTQELLRLAAVLGTTFSLDQLAAVADRDSLEVANQLRPAFDEALLGDEGTAAAFRHDLVRDAIYDSLPAAERVAIHHRIGQCFSAIGAPPATVAQHLAVGAARGDTEAVRWLRKAGLDAAAQDSDVAIAFLERALALSSPSDPRRHGLATALANELVVAGRAADAERYLRATLAHADEPTVEALLRAGLGNLLTGSRRFNEARDEFLRSTRIADDVVIRLSTQAAACANAVYAGDFTTAGNELIPLEAAADAHHVAFASAIATVLLGMAHAARGDVEAAIDLGQRGAIITGSAESFWGAFLLPHLALAPALLAADRIGEARTGLQTGRALAAERNMRAVVPAYDRLLALCDYLEGQWDDASTLGVDAASLRRELGWTYLDAPAASVAVLVTSARGGASNIGTAGIADVAIEVDGHPIYCIEYADLAAAALTDRPNDAARILSQAWNRRRPFHLPGFAPAVGTELVAALLAADEPASASTIADELLDLAASTSAIPSLTAAGLRARGLVDQDPEPLLAAVDALEQSPRIHQRSTTLADAGIVIASHDPTRAQQLLADALDGYELLEARREIAALIETARHAGVNLRPRRRPARPRVGWEALTPTELNVIAAVARGLTNGEIAAEMYVSRYTIESHLKHVFTKLAVRSRTELAHRGALHGI